MIAAGTAIVKPICMRVGILQTLIRKHRYQLLITYSLFSLEMAGALLRPFFLGMAVNDLISGSYRGLIYLSVIHGLWLLMGTVRHMYDTRTFSAIYTELVTRFLTRRSNNTQVSKLSAHSTLSREFIDFLEFDLAYILEAVYNIFGSLLLLYFYDSAVVGICFALLLPVIGLSYLYGRKLRRLNQLKNNELERQVDIIAGGEPEYIKAHYNKLRKWQIKISDKEAINFGLIEIMVLLIITSSLLIANQRFGTTVLAGNLIGIYTYILKFVSGLDTIPYVVQRISLLTDISKRIGIDEDDLEKAPKDQNNSQAYWLKEDLKLTA